MRAVDPGSIPGRCKSFCCFVFKDTSSRGQERASLLLTRTMRGVARRLLFTSVERNMVALVARDVLKHQLDLCSNIAASAKTGANGLYARECPVAKASIGGHVRHTLHHYQALVSVCEDPNLMLDYDHRPRGTPVEKDVRVAIEQISSCCHKLEALSKQEDVLAMAIRPVFQISSGADRPIFAEFSSNTLRELWFVAHHAIHHNASIKSIIMAWDDSDEKALLINALPANFGVAPSTQSYSQDREG